MCKFWCERVFSIFLGTALGVELLGHMIVSHSSFRRTVSCFLKRQHCFIFPPAVNNGVPTVLTINTTEN